MRRCDTYRADQNKNHLTEKIAFKKQIGKSDKTNAGNKKKQSSDFAVLFEITGQKARQSHGDGKTDKNIFDAFVRQKRDAEQRQKGNYKRHRQTVNGASPGNRRARFVPETAGVE